MATLLEASLIAGESGNKEQELFLRKAAVENPSRTMELIRRQLRSKEKRERWVNLTWEDATWLERAQMMGWAIFGFTFFSMCLSIPVIIILRMLFPSMPDPSPPTLYLSCLTLGLGISTYVVRSQKKFN